MNLFDGINQLHNTLHGNNYFNRQFFCCSYYRISSCYLLMLYLFLTYLCQLISRLVLPTNSITQFNNRFQGPIDAFLHLFYFLLLNQLFVHKRNDCTIILENKTTHYTHHLLILWTLPGYYFYGKEVLQCYKYLNLITLYWISVKTHCIIFLSLSRSPTTSEKSTRKVNWNTWRRTNQKETNGSWHLQSIAEYSWYENCD